MDEQNVTYTHNGALFSLNEECNYVDAGKWMELEIFISSEINQTKKDKHFIFSFLCNIYSFKKRLIFPISEHERNFCLLVSSSTSFFNIL
jgi:hypothetical protein